MLNNRKYDLEERLIEFALSIISISEQLPKNYLGIHFAKQIVRSGTAPAFQYAEARGAESRKDFIHKLKIGLKELRETHVCLRIIMKKPLITGSGIDALIKECDQLIAIFTSSINTAKKNNNLNIS